MLKPNYVRVTHLDTDSDDDDEMDVEKSSSEECNVQSTSSGSSSVEYIEQNSKYVSSPQKIKNTHSRWFSA